MYQVTIFSLLQFCPAERHPISYSYACGGAFLYEPKVASSISDLVIGILRLLKPSGCSMALRSTQPLTEKRTRDISWGYRPPMVRADKLTIFICQFSGHSGSLSILEP